MHILETYLCDDDDDNDDDNDDDERRSSQDNFSDVNVSNRQIPPKVAPITIQDISKPAVKEYKNVCTANSANSACNVDKDKLQTLVSRARVLFSFYFLIFEPKSSQVGTHEIDCF